MKAHFNKREMVVEQFVRRSCGATWKAETIEREIFQQLNKAGLRIESVEGWGFLDFLHNSKSTVGTCHSCLSRTITDAG